MAITFTNLGSSADPPDILARAGNPTSASNSSWTPPSTGLVGVWVQARDTTTAAITPTVTHSGGSVTFTQVGSTLDCDSGGGNGISLFVANASSMSTGVTTIDFGSATQAHIIGFFFQVEGVDTSGGLGSIAAQQPTTTGTGTSGNLTFAAAADSNNRMMAMSWHKANETKTGDANWTVVDQENGAGQNGSNMSQWRTDATDTLVEFSWSTSADYATMGVEFKVASAGEPAISASDSVSVAESITVDNDDDYASVTESVGVADTPTLSIGDPAVFVSDAVGVADAVTVDNDDLYGSVSDAVGVADELQPIRLRQTNVSTSDSVSVADTVTVTIAEIGALSISVSDGVTVGDAPAADNPTDYASVSDAVSVADSPTVTVGAGADPQISVSDAVGVADSPSAAVTDPAISVSDAVGVAEAVTVSLITAGDIAVSVSDAVSVADTVTAVVSDPAVSASDAISIAEAVTTTNSTDFVTTSDSVSVGETIVINIGDLDISASESIAVTDSLAVSFPGVTYQINVTDAIAVAESVTAFTAYNATPDQLVAAVFRDNRVEAKFRDNREEAVYRDNRK